MIVVSKLRAGAAKSDITPPIGTTMDGYAHRTRPSEGIHDRLFSKALVIEDSTKSLALIACDVCWFTQGMVEEIRRRVEKIGVDSLALVATHNHSGPAMADLLIGPTESGTEYLHELPSLVAETAQMAIERVQLVSLSLGRGKAWVSLNRRKPYGEVDPEVITLILRSQSGQPIAGLLNYACHPTVLGPENRQISAEYPGRCTDLIERHFGGEFACLFLNGACGDINPITCIGYGCHGTFSDVMTIAESLSRVSIEGSNFAEIQTAKGIRAMSSTVGPFPPKGLSFKVNAMSLGDLVFLCVPGELFASTGLALKQYSGVSNLVVAGYTNGYVGYLPTEDAFVRNDYETSEICWVDKSADEAIRLEAASLAKRTLVSD
jgi:neutral ceramidase